MIEVTSTRQLGDFLRERRKELGFTQARAAVLAGVGVRFLRELEHGKPTCEVGKVLRVCRSLGVRIEVTGA